MKKFDVQKYVDLDVEVNIYTSKDSTEKETVLLKSKIDSKSINEVNKFVKFSEELEKKELMKKDPLKANTAILTYVYDIDEKFVEENLDIESCTNIINYVNEQFFNIKKK